MRKIYELVKRTADILISLVLLILLLPVFIIIGIIIKCDSKGPAIFAQKRVGRNGRIFTLYKFRTMVFEAENLKSKYLDLNKGSGPLFKIWNDPRFTGVGKFFRDTNIDELPQLWNIFKGNMSLIGPRPFLPEETKALSEEYKARLKVKPGLVSLWHVSGKYGFRMDFKEWMESDIYYVCNLSLFLDLQIFFKSIFTVLNHCRLKLFEKIPK